MDADPQVQDTLSFGWKMKDDHYILNWFHGDAAPKIVDVVQQMEGDNFSLLPWFFFLSA